MSAGIESVILSRILDPSKGDIPPDLARYMLELQFTAADQERMAFLSAKAQEGTLTSEEDDELEGYLNVNDFLSIMQSKARISLDHASPR